VDIQQENIEFVRKNIRLLPKHIKVFTYNCSFSSLNLDIDFDIILSNPPYFEKNRGRRSSNINKQICRTFEHDSYHELVECIKRHSNKSTRSFLVLRDQKNLKVIKKINNAYIGELVFE
jgi:tRNA1(Val) A37 N6-methylase TrmN6